MQQTSGGWIMQDKTDTNSDKDETAVPKGSCPREAWGHMNSGTLAEREQTALRAALPPLPPAEREPVADRRPLTERLGVRLTHDSAQEDRFRRHGRAEDGDIVARLTVYAINLTIMVFAFPVGFGLMLFNILGGENLRTTAHVMALTGLGVVLAETEPGLRILGI
jgi:hypothetical protein